MNQGPDSVYHDFPGDANIENEAEWCHFDGEMLPKGVEGFECQGGRFTAKVPIESGNRKGGGLRGRVQGMSRASRRRLMAKFASLDWSFLAKKRIPIYFVTLTTPMEYWDRPKEVYMALRRFRRRFASFRSSKFHGVFVRRELGEFRGMLHYHLITIGHDGFDTECIELLWSKCLGDYRQVRCDVQLLGDSETAAKYLSKYCAKAAYMGKEKEAHRLAEAGTEAANGAPLSKAHNGTSDNEPDEYTGGRWWYIWGSETLPWAECYVVTGEDARGIVKRIRRIFRRWRAAKLREARRKDCLKKNEPWHHLDRLTSVKIWSRSDPFSESLRKSATGFTLLVSPDVLGQMIDAASYGYQHINQGVPF